MSQVSGRLVLVDGWGQTGQRVRGGGEEGNLGSVSASSQVNGHLSLVQVVWDGAL